MQDPLVKELDHRVSRTESDIATIKLKIGDLHEIPQKIESMDKKLDKRNETIFGFFEKHGDILTELKVSLANKPNIQDCDKKHDRLFDIKDKSKKSVLDIIKWVLVVLTSLGIGMGGKSILGG